MISQENITKSVKDFQTQYELSISEDPAVPQALIPQENITKAIKDFQTQYELSISDTGRETVLRHPTKRRSCAMVNTPSPCVHKAIHHIEELKVKIEKWIQQHEDETDKHKDV
uniref:Coiled-coil domain-containing protein 178-like n=1 Tax=Geotrypetes seraphini TaxID=260995 RepID=A0A6P8Q710_GEOSA|nr:coiled-coil domain-containing protein 178-like [Geotrypetes seraphini]